MGKRKRKTKLAVVKKPKREWKPPRPSLNTVVDDPELLAEFDDDFDDETPSVLSVTIPAMAKNVRGEGPRLDEVLGDSVSISSVPKARPIQMAPPLSKYFTAKPMMGIARKKKRKKKKKKRKRKDD